MAFPAPQGPLGVGCITLELVDTSRPTQLCGQSPGRALFLKLWYPSAHGALARSELAWQSVRDSRRTPALVRAVLAMLRHRTASRPRAPIATGSRWTSVVIYNHGLVSFAEENFSLMEALASEGHIAISIEHGAQMPELQALNARQSPEERRASAAIGRRLVRATPTERAALAREYYAASPNTARIVRERAADTRWVLDRIESLLHQIPGWSPERESGMHVHLVGFSLGGAVAVETALHDARITSVTNIDGGTQGSIDARALAVPCLMLYSEGNAGMNDALLPQGCIRQVVPGTRHLNFHDVAGLLPVLRLTPALGVADPCMVLGERNRRVSGFLAKWIPGNARDSGGKTPGLLTVLGTSIR
jgi:dienelactone hydrolase